LKHFNQSFLTISTILKIESFVECQNESFNQTTSTDCLWLHTFNSNNKDDESPMFESKRLWTYSIEDLIKSECKVAFQWW
jgi:hypothetical protein